MRSPLLPALALALGFALACGSDEGGSTAASAPAAAPAAPVAHCDAIATLSNCVEYTSQSEADEDCKTSWESTAQPGACPADGAVVRCKVGERLRIYYSSGGMPSDKAAGEAHCRNAMGGEPI